MRIAMISTLSRPVPPKAEGSIELLVHQLTEYLVGQGHEVTLFALPGSTTSAKLVSPLETSYVDDPDKWDWQLYEAFQVRQAFLRWKEFDVINCHSYFFGMMFSDFVPVPVINSLHIDAGPDYRFLAEHTQNRHFHFCSRYQARDFSGLNDCHVIPHGIEISNYGVAPATERENYLVWLGRFHPDKGVIPAIRLARHANLPLKLAGPSNNYLRQVVLPYAANDDVEYIGEASGNEKTTLLSKAYALLYPIERGEPFGLVLIEAMACGLPVIAMATGAVPEIIEDGVTGFLGDTHEDLCKAIADAPTLDRERIRAVAEERFSSRRMAEQLEKLMFAVVDAGKRPPFGKAAV